MRNPAVADGGGEPAEEQGSVLGVLVELFGEFDGAMDLLDDDPFVPVPPSGWPLTTLLAIR
ncbi:hypothetical protein [Streptomyces sp. NBC_01367]|uniref:hypothetical protein n=1 Tax=Streptomyces sp. NBC_01367 TaxID=2903841 RepID=UPI0032434C89